MTSQAYANSHQRASKPKRIFSNSLWLFIRMLFIMIVNLYAVRVVLNNLGEIDYGIFNAVAGVILTSTFITQTLALTIQRFYSYALGENTQNGLQDIFSVSIILVSFISIAIIIIFETIGLWFVNTRLTIPSESIADAKWLFHFSLATFILTLLQIPYTAAVFAHEDMGLFSFISSFDCLLKLICALLLIYIPNNRLAFYGAELLIVTSIISIIYAIIAHRRYMECRFKRITKTSIASQLLSFTGWTLYGNVSGVAMIQGSTILLNIFFGPLANAAFGIANQIYNALNSLGNSIVIAFRPAMIKSYAEQQYDYLNNLFYIHNKAMFYLIASVAIPLLFEMRLILEWWLGIVSYEMVFFSRLFVLYLVLIIMCNPISTIIQATGNVKYYSLVVESITILCLPISWLCFKYGYPSEYLFYTMIAVCIVAHIARLYFLKQYYKSFSYSQYCIYFLFPAILCTTICCLATYTISHYIASDLIQFFVIFTAAPIILFVCAYFISISKNEKVALHRILKQVTHR